MRFRVDIIDTWNMTITPLKKIIEIEKLNRYTYIDTTIAMPGKPYMALRIQCVE